MMIDKSTKHRKYCGSYRFLTVNDVYAFKPDRHGTGGFMQLATLLRKYRRDKDCSFIVAGDFLGGSSIAVEFEGKNVIDTLNELGVDYVVLGNHEFDCMIEQRTDGAEKLQTRIAESNFQWFGSNVRNTSNGELMGGVTDTLLQPVQCHATENAGREPITAHIGFFGLCTEITAKLSYPGESVKFEPIEPRAQACVDQLRNKAKAPGRQEADVVVALTHVSLNEDKNLTRHVKGIDIILGGHDHLPYGEFHEDTFIFKCGESAHWLGCLDIDIEITVAPDGTKETHIFPSWRMIINRGYDLDPAVERLYNTYLELQMNAQEGMDEVLAKVVGDELPTFTDTVRRKEAAFPSMVADAMLHEYRDYSPQFSIINGGFVRGNSSYPNGALLTVYHIRNELPFPRGCLCVRMRGANILSALEVMLAMYPRPSGAFPHLSSGCRLVYDDEKPPGSRVVSVTIRGEALNPQQEYTLVISSFMAMGGDENESFSRNTKVADHGKHISESVIEYLRTTGTIDARTEGRVSHVSHLVQSTS